MCINLDYLSEAEASRADWVVVFMDDAINVHPVEHGLCLRRLDSVHVNLLPSVSQCEDSWAIADILLQGRPETRAQTLTF